MYIYSCKHTHMMLIIFSRINAINGPIFPLQPHPFLALLWQRFAIGISAVPLQLWPTKACLPATCGAVPGNLATASTRPMFVAGTELLGSMIWEYEEALYKWNMMELYIYIVYFLLVQTIGSQNLLERTQNYSWIQLEMSLWARVTRWPSAARQKFCPMGRHGAWLVDHSHGCLAGAELALLMLRWWE